MSETIDLRLLGGMVSRLQATVEDVRSEYASIRASLDTLNNTVFARFAEFNVRMSSLELAQMRLAGSVDNAHTKIDRLQVGTQEVRSDMSELRFELSAIKELIISRLPER